MEGFPYDAPVSYDAALPYDAVTPMPIFGCDYSYSRDTIDIPAMARDGVRFACRYLRDGSKQGKALLPAESGRLHQAGIAIVSNDETTGVQYRGGFDGGRRDAAAALAAHLACGGPPDRPIYFTPLDHDPASLDEIGWNLLRGYARGVVDVLGVARVGWYGGTVMLGDLRSRDLGRWWWQSLGWRGGVWLEWAHIQQYDNGNQRWNGEVDYDRALVADYGQWGGTLSATGPASWDDADWQAWDAKRGIRLAQWIAGKTNTVYNATSVGVPAPASTAALADLRTEFATDVQAILDAVSKGTTVTFDPSSLTADQLLALGKGLAGALVIEGMQVQNNQLVVTLTVA